MGKPNTEPVILNTSPVRISGLGKEKKAGWDPGHWLVERLWTNYGYNSKPSLLGLLLHEKKCEKKLKNLLTQGGEVRIVPFCRLTAEGDFFWPKLQWVLLFDNQVAVPSNAWVSSQATKGVRWMPWHQQAMKDVVSCDKSRGAASRQ